MSKEYLVKSFSLIYVYFIDSSIKKNITENTFFWNDKYKLNCKNS